MIIRPFTLSGRLAILWLLVLAAPTALAQEVPLVFGKVTAADFVAAPADSAAPAVMLCDFGQSKIVGGREGFQLEYVRTARILIRRKAGYSWATVEVPLYRQNEQTERFKKLKGITYNLVDGKLIQEKMAENAVFKDEQDKNHTSYRFTLPNVREGSIIEFTYTVESDFLFNLQAWRFQHTIPTRWSEYRTVIPAYFRYKQITRSFLPFTVQEEKPVPYSATIGSRVDGGPPGEDYHIATQALSSRWVIQNVPALREEPYMTALRDYFASVEFELSTVQYGPDQEPKDVSATWESISKELWKDERFGRDLQAKPLLAAVPDFLTRYPDARERLAATVALVQHTLKYNGQRRLYAEKTLKDAVGRGQGNSAEVNLLLIQSLRAAGLDAAPLLLSTRSHGHALESMPVLNNFNHVVVHVRLPDNTDILVDATEPVIPPGMLPADCLNGNGRLITQNPAQTRWISLAPQFRQTHFSSTTLALEADGNLTGTTHWEWNGYAGVDARTTTAATLVRTLQQRLGDETTQPSTAKWTNVNDRSRPLILDLPLKLAVEPGALLYLTLMARLGIQTTPFRTENRYFPVDFGTAQEETHQLTITLPPGTIVAERPKNLSLVLPNNGGRFTYACQQEGNKLQFVSRLYLARTQYSAAEYSALREFYAQVVAKHAEALVVTAAKQP